jgi:hypothetical protein
MAILELIFALIGWCVPMPKAERAAAPRVASGERPWPWTF